MTKHRDEFQLPTNAEWVLHGIVKNLENNWLAKANVLIQQASDDPMPYALAPLSESDFTDPSLKRLFAICVKSQSEDEAMRRAVDASLEHVYQRITIIDAIGKEFFIPFDYNVFSDRIYQLRLDRLRIEYRNAESNKDRDKARECVMAIACLQLAQEDLI